MADLEIKDQEITLNIRYDMHEEDWKDLVGAFELMPYWIGVEKTGAFFGLERKLMKFTLKLP